MLKIKELREEKGLMQKELGDIIGISQNTLSQYENGKREPDYETLKKIAEYFDVSTDYLLGLVDVKNPEANPDEIQVAFSSGFAGLNEENKQTAMNIIAGLKAKQELEGKWYDF